LATVIKNGEVIGFDAPEKPVGISQRAVEAAASPNIYLSYNSIANNPEKSRLLLTRAGFAGVLIQEKLVNRDPVTLAEAIAFWDYRRDHPARASLSQSSREAREASRTEYVRLITAASSSGYVDNSMVLNFATGRKLCGN
jgi:hypothetical protein